MHSLFWVEYYDLYDINQLIDVLKNENVWMVWNKKQCPVHTYQNIRIGLVWQSSIILADLNKVPLTDIYHENSHSFVYILVTDFDQLPRDSTGQYLSF